MAKPAASGGSMTNHGGALEPNEGIPSVTINGQPVWVSRRTHTSGSHGAEGTPTGSETVLVSGQRVQREGDFLLGKGAPNRIDVGSPNVVVGGPLAGVIGNAASRGGSFCSEHCALKRDWPNLSPAEREARYKQLVGNLFESFGAPPPILTTNEAGGAAGSWSDRSWELNLPPGAFEKSKPPTAKTTLHEARHAEQTFVAVRHKTSRELSGQSEVPDHVEDAARARPLDPRSAEDRWARVMYAENYTKEGRRALNEAIASDNREDYERRPVGQDALDVERACQCRC